MSSRRFLSLLLAAVCVSAHASTLAQIISPVCYVVADANDRRVVPLDGKPVFYCGYNSFERWARPLAGQPVSSNAKADMTVLMDRRPISLAQLLVAHGWLQPTVLDDAAQAAITEGRGGWACASAQTPFELMHTSVDPKVLAGIALNESGLHGRAWPWTLNVAGRGFFFRTREDAYRVVELLIGEHRCDFDVGIMQVNWCYHAHRFASPWDALAPATNIHVAEEILNENYRKTRSIVEAVAYYHSANPAPGQAYLERFKRHLSLIEKGL